MKSKDGSSIKVAVVGASGYAGAEAVRILLDHPTFEVSVVTSARSAGQPLRDLCPWLDTDLVLEAYRRDFEVDAYLLCQETGFASEEAPFLEKDCRVVDLSADFRLESAADYEAAYQKPWPNGRLAHPPIYGLPELVGRDRIAQARVVANPGCYPTASLLALMPLLEKSLVQGTPVIDAKSGVSGAGRSRTETEYLFSELQGSFKAYKPTGHRHVVEINQMTKIPVRFTPHLIPIARGMEATLHAPIGAEVDLQELYRARYRNDPFVRVRSEEPTTKQVLGSNACVLSATYDRSTGFAVVRSVIDNLGKGAAGQAIQNLNLMFGLEETVGLTRSGLWP